MKYLIHCMEYDTCVAGEIDITCHIYDNLEDAKKYLQTEREEMLDDIENGDNVYVYKDEEMELYYENEKYSMGYKCKIIELEKNSEITIYWHFFKNLL